MHFGLVELLRRQHGGEHRDLGAELHVHQRLDHGVGDEFVAIDATVNDKAGRDDRGVAPGLGEDLRMQRDLERARHLEHVDMGEVARFGFLDEGDAGFLDHVAVPAGLHEGHPLRLCETRVLGRRRINWNRRLGCLGRFDLRFGVGKFGFGDLATSDSWLSSVKDQNQGTRNDKQPHPAMRLPPTVLFHPDFNRRLRSCTNLLTLPFGKILFRKPLREGARGLRPFGPYRRWGLSPRPENYRPPVMGGLSGIMTPAGAAARAFLRDNPHVPMPRWRNPGGRPGRAESRMGTRSGGSNFGFLLVNNCGGDELWTNES